MLSRRHIRIKTLQALYQHFLNPAEAGVQKGTKDLRASIENIYELFLYEMKAVAEMRRIAEDRLETRKNRKLPSAEDLNPSLNFVENRFLQWLENDEEFQKEVEQNHIKFGDDRDILRRLFKKFEKEEEYQDYLAAPTVTLDDDKFIVKLLYGKYITTAESLHHFYEEKDKHWADDLDAAQMMVDRAIKKFKKEENSLPPLLKENSDTENGRHADLDFAIVLFQKVIANSEKYEQWIHNKSRNWETDRLALMDVILMKLALAEMTNFPQIPIKVTLNEYIELSKQYSTPKSANFINGVLDKLVAELKKSGEIRKIGRGLI